MRAIATHAQWRQEVHGHLRSGAGRSGSRRNRSPEIVPKVGVRDGDQRLDALPFREHREIRDAVVGTQERGDLVCGAPFGRIGTSRRVHEAQSDQLKERMIMRAS